jgi:sugar/nucleoside kinase (ribokinase family)
VAAGAALSGGGFSGPPVNDARSYDIVVGTGGVGTGIFLALEGNHTLGREESRAAELLDRRDYCKLHIVSHYVQQLMGSDFLVVPIGKVGHDDRGRTVVEEMRQAGMDVSRVTLADRPTLFSVCFLYPDGDGGNLTTNTSASQAVSPGDIRDARAVFAAHRGRGIAVALPEVPLESRGVLLELATEHQFLRAATFVAGEIEGAIASRVLAHVDLLAVNLDEAAMIAGAAESEATDVVVKTAIARLEAMHPGIRVVVTAGRKGSWAWDGRALSHAPALDVAPVNTAGAGDAHLAGLLVATARGFDLATANRFASLVSGLNVTSRHTIEPDVTPAGLNVAARAHGLQLDPALFAPR